MKKNNDKVAKIIVVLLLISVIIMFSVWFKNKMNYQVKQEVVAEVYGYFNSKDMDVCDGLLNYADDKVTYKDISNENKLCLAYQKIDLKKSSEKETITKDKKTNTCTKDGMVFRLDEKEKNCTITKIDKTKLNDSYDKLFGKEMEEEKSFKSDGMHICYIKKDTIYCGLSENISYVLWSDINVYRVIEKTREKGSTVEIYDYFIKTTGNKCYNSYTTEQANNSCPNKIKKVNYKFLRRYGTLYKHTFKKDKDTYYWVSSEPVKK